MIYSRTGPMSGANGALLWIVFKWDKAKMLNKFPDLKIISISYHTLMCYLLSEGVSMRNLILDWPFHLFEFIEKGISPLSIYYSMFQTIEVFKVR